MTGKTPETETQPITLFRKRVAGGFHYRKVVTLLVLMAVIPSGQEEFYDCGKDPHEWTNQINNPEYASAITKLRASVPALPQMMPPVPSDKGNKSND